MKFAELIEHCIECIKTFNPVVKTIDSHADDYIRPVSLIIHLLLAVQRPVWKGFYQASLLWMHSLLGLPKGKHLNL